MKWLLLLGAFAPLYAQCNYVVTYDPSVTSVGPGAATGSITGQAAVTTSNNCAWTPRASVSWLRINVGQLGGTGNGIVGWSVDRNPLPQGRSGQITIATTNITITQAPAQCDYSASPTTITLPAAGGNASFLVKATCQWGIGANVTWITFPGVQGGNFDGSQSFTVAPNLCLGSRAGLIAYGLNGVQVNQVAVNQDGSPANLTLTPSSLTLPSAATDGRVNVSIGSGCPWSAFSDVSWLHLTGGTFGSGNGFVSYIVDANPSSQRTGAIHVGPQLFTITQQSAPTPLPAIAAVTNAASGLQGPVSPGEIISIFGTALGPATGAGLELTPDGNSVTKTLAGVQVLFGGTAAPLTYVSAKQVNVVVPYDVSVSGTQMQVLYQGNTSAIQSLPVQDAAPGIFTLDASGGGPGAILNQDFSVNGSANRAARGSVIQIFCTGGGITDPPVADGALTGTPLPHVIQPVSVTIGGIPAGVVYAGGAPTSIAGLTQINAVVPNNAVPGISLPVVVKIGSWQSQPNVTVAVK